METQLNQIYKCNKCGNIVEILHSGVGTLVCCDEPMELLVEKTQDQGYEKHVPVIEKTHGKIKVKIGSIPHPMEELHYIEWVEIMFDGKVDRKYLKPGEKPEVEFNVFGENVVARIYCNVHGLWKS